LHKYSCNKQTLYIIRTIDILGASDHHTILYLHKYKKPPQNITVISQQAVVKEINTPIKWAHGTNNNSI